MPRDIPLHLRHTSVSETHEMCPVSFQHVMSVVMAMTKSAWRYMEARSRQICPFMQALHPMQPLSDTLSYIPRGVVFSAAPDWLFRHCS